MPESKQLAAIVTIVDLSSRGRQLINRLCNLASQIEGSEFDLVIGHCNRGNRLDEELKTRLATFQMTKIVSVAPNGNYQELARLRNSAVLAVDAKYLILLDADIYPDIQLFKSLTNSVINGEPLSIAPCLYLTHRGTCLLNRKDGALQVLTSALNFSTQYILHWAMPSSVVALRRSDYWEVGGFCEEYKDHGYEDFDFILRLALHLNILKPSYDLLIDRTYRSPFLSQGFRSALGSLCIKNLISEKIAFHMYHRKNVTSPYHMNRSKNSKIFQERMRALISRMCLASTSDVVPEIITGYYSECKLQGINPEKFQALFDVVPRYLRVSKPLWHRISLYIFRLVDKFKYSS